jgi:hypothetical protein
MPDISDSRQTATAYPQTETYAEWSDHADELDMSVSRYILAMVEVGRKEIDLSIDHDDETVELRTQRNDLKRELDDARRRIEYLEKRLYRGERGAILDVLEEEQTVPFGVIVQRIIDDAPTRVARALDEMDGDEIVVEDGEYRLTEGAPDE